VIERLQNIVGRSYVLTDDQSTRQYRQGRRFGEIIAIWGWTTSESCIGRLHNHNTVCLNCSLQHLPLTLLEQWQVLQAAIEADCIVIMQAANTGLTGGSTLGGTDAYFDHRSKHKNALQYSVNVRSLLEEKMFAWWFPWWGESACCGGAGDLARAMASVAGCNWGRLYCDYAGGQYIRTPYNIL
jgi:hypothetical protein